MTALNRAIARADSDVVIIHDSDCWLEPAKLRELVAMAVASARWAIPTFCVRLTRAATRRVLASEPSTCWSLQDLEDPLNPFQRCGQPENFFSERPVPIPEPLAVIQSAALRAIGPLDDSPWGAAEWWAGVALDTLIGAPAVLPALACHLWHMIEPVGSHRMWLRRLVQYELAAGDRRATLELVAGEDLDDVTLLRLMEHWSIATFRAANEDWLDVACSTLTHLGQDPAPQLAESSR